MTDKKLQESWQLYGVEIDGQIRPLEDLYVVCWGYQNQLGGVGFDTGGEVHSLRVDKDGTTLLSVDPENHDEIKVLGKLRKLK